MTLQVLKTVVLAVDRPFDLIVARKAVERSGLVDRCVAFGVAAEALAYLQAGPAAVDRVLLDLCGDAGRPAYRACRALAEAGTLPPTDVFLAEGADAAVWAEVRALGFAARLVEAPISAAHMRAIAAPEAMAI